MRGEVQIAGAKTSGPRASYARDAAHFFRAWMAAPLRTGAQLPSGRELAKAMAAAVDPDAPGVVVELGSGTGAITQALVERGIAEERLILIEADPQFCALAERALSGRARALAAMPMRRRGCCASSRWGRSQPWCPDCRC